MYLETRDIDDVMKIYSTAWEKGLKTFYYLLYETSSYSWNKSTVSVPIKSQSMGKVILLHFLIKLVKN